MIEGIGPATRWVTLTNLMLGAAVVVVLAGISIAMVVEIVRKRKVRKMSLQPRDGETLRELGITLADGGEPIDEVGRLDSEKKRDRH